MAAPDKPVNHTGLSNRSRQWIGKSGVVLRKYLGSLSFIRSISPTENVWRESPKRGLDTIDVQGYVISTT